MSEQQTSGKQCRRCERVLAESQFPFKNKTARRRMSVCADCRRAYGRAHYAANADSYKRRIAPYNRRTREANKARLRDHLARNPCVDCGESDPVVLDFDHVRGTKVGDVTRLAEQAWSWAKIADEIAKCEVRCANCHRRRTARVAKWARLANGD